MSSAYNPAFTEISSIKALTGEEISDTSDPNTAQVLQWIEQIEKEMIAKGYYTESLTGVIIDVPEGEPVRDTSLWIYDDPIYASSSSGRTIALPNTPFISVANVQRNLQGYEQTPDWEDLTEGPAAGSDFLIIKRKYKAGLRGVALFFYRNAPGIGYQRLKLDYVWGYNLPSTVLAEYAAARVSVMFLYAKYMRKEPIFNLNIAGMRTQLNKFTEVHQYILDRIELIELEWLPSEYIGAALLP